MSARSLGAPPPLPTLAVLGSPARARAAAAAAALVLARRHRRPAALVATIGASPPGSGLATPFASRCAAGLRRAGAEALAAGRLVWLSGAAGEDSEGPPNATGAASRSAPTTDGESLSTEVAAIGAVLADAAHGAGVPAVIAISAGRCDDVDALLAACDALLIVARPEATDSLAPLVLASLEALGRPVVAIEPLSRAAAALATAGLQAPASVAAALSSLDAEGPQR